MIHQETLPVPTGRFDRTVAAAETEPPRVLCIDDDPSFSLALKLRLESHGIAVIRAFDGMEGFRRAFSRDTDVILLDCVLPNGQGDYILRRLKDNPVTKPLPVIAITGHKNREMQRRMIALGADSFMYKPLEFSELLSELGRHISVLPRAAGDRSGADRTAQKRSGLPGNCLRA